MAEVKERAWQTALELTSEAPTEVEGGEELPFYPIVENPEDEEAAEALGGAFYRAGATRMPQ